MIREPQGSFFLCKKHIYNITETWYIALDGRYPNGNYTTYKKDIDRQLND